MLKKLQQRTAPASRGGRASRSAGFTLKVRIIALVSILLAFTLLVVAFNYQSSTRISLAAEAQENVVASQAKEIARQTELVEEQIELNARLDTMSQLIGLLNQIQYTDFYASLTLIFGEADQAELLKDEFERALEEALEGFPAHETALEELRGAFADYRILTARMFEFYERNQPGTGKSMADAAWDEANRMTTVIEGIMADYTQAIDQGRSGVSAASQALEASGGTLRESARGILSEVRIAQQWSLISALAMVVMAVLLGLIFLRSVLRPVQQVGAHIQRMETSNDLADSIQYQRRDELSVITQAFNNLIGKFDHIVRNIASAVTELSQVAEQNRQSTQEADQQVQAQTEQLEQVATASNQMATTALTIQENSEQAAQAANDVDAAAMAGAQEMETGRGLVEHLDERITSAKTVIQSLAQQSESIGGVLDVIRGVSEQTNLLALNAAIEAARAGDHGRGFAVVADEVRSLASRTSESAGEIQRMVEALQADATRAVDEIMASNEVTIKTVEQIRVTGQALAEIQSRVGAIRSINDHIAQSTAEQSEVARSIDSNLEAIRQSSDVVNHSVQSSHRASGDLDRATAQLRQLISQFNPESRTKVDRP